MLASDARSKWSPEKEMAEWPHKVDETDELIRDECDNNGNFLECAQWIISRNIWNGNVICLAIWPYRDRK
jgi:hypothetical protein